MHNVGMKSYRQEGNGSIFIQIVCKALSEYALRMEMTQILTKVSCIPFKRISYFITYSQIQDNFLENKIIISLQYF